MLYTVGSKRELPTGREVLRLTPDDSSGRPILLSKRMWAAFREVQSRCDFNITIVQGAFMRYIPGGGAPGSAGYHDGSGCIDTRTWDIDSREERRVIIQARTVGWAIWRRDQQHGGFDEHMHWCLLDEPGSAPGAQEQWASYRRGGDGLSPEGKDYHWRPDKPLPVFDFKAWRKDHNE